MFSVLNVGVNFPSILEKDLNMSIYWKISLLN